MSPSSSLTSFHHFPLLPTELRLKVWHYALLSPPRLIPLFYNAFTSSFILVLGLTPRNGHDWSRSHPSSAVPFALKSVPFACSEAYQLFKESDIVPLEHSIAATRILTTPYNPNLDVILFSQRVEPGTISAFVSKYPLHAAKTRKLAISSLKYPVQVLGEMIRMVDLDEVFVEWHKPSPSAGDGWNDWWAQGLEKPYDTKWELQEALTKVLDRFRLELPSWRLPAVTVIEHWEEILKGLN